MGRFKARGMSIVIGALALASAARADTVRLRFVGTGLGRNVQTTYGAVTQNVFAGQLRHEFSNGTGTVGSTLTGTLLTYCSDLTQYVTTSFKPYQVVELSQVPNPAMGSAKAEAIRNMYAFAHDAQFATTDNNSNKDLAAAFQIAVWEIAFDYSGGRGSLDVETGDFRARRTNGGALSAGIMAHLNNLLNATGTRGEYKRLYGLKNDSSQDQIVQTRLVPLPTAAGMGMTALIAMGARRRRR